MYSDIREYIWLSNVRASSYQYHMDSTKNVHYTITLRWYDFRLHDTKHAPVIFTPRSVSYTLEDFLT